MTDELKQEPMNDHARLCQGREYTCTCGYDAERDAAIEALRAENERLEQRIKALQDRITWHRDGFREMSKWSPEVAAERTRQFALDTLTGPTTEALAQVPVPVASGWSWRTLTISIRMSKSALPRFFIRLR
ncbi:MAG: hypothetical protein QMD99_19255, partial [Rhizobiaceae bacterium]|nr:hypothetical protein [Rhizobiaceae bacterium]